MIQIYFYKKNFDAQKAERWFKERRIPVQMVDLARVKLGQRELQSVCARVGLDALIDKEGSAWKECPARYAAGEEAVLRALAEDPRRMRLPIVRGGRLATIGFKPDQWEAWE
ncbi:MAG: ArsC family transcriptional regulator [Firmicutes bacterium]|nr:ArsC family transcriptional regulator [Bacillota bacterium]